MPEIWMISNRQPWVHALVRRWISSKTRSAAVSLPPVGTAVLLHASKALWKGWQRLRWANMLDVKGMDRGGIVAVAILDRTGPTHDVMPYADISYFELDDVPARSCAGDITMVFKDLRPLQFIPCRGAQVPTRKIPMDALPLLAQQGVAWTVCYRCKQHVLVLMTHIGTEGWIGRMLCQQCYDATEPSTGRIKLSNIRYDTG